MRVFKKVFNDVFHENLKELWLICLFQIMEIMKIMDAVLWNISLNVSQNVRKYYDIKMGNF